MATITMDGHSLALDGRRMWLVSGTVHMARTPRELWAHRLRLAKHAGLNTIEVPVVWAHHEPLKGKFDFKGQRDIGAFCQLAGEMGLRVIVRVGPFIGEGYDLGGIPAWLVPLTERKVRVGSPEYLQACSKYLTKLSAQLKEHQAERKGAAPGPIVMVQYEHGWECGDDAAADAYLKEIGRFLREGGISVPFVNRNQLFAGQEADIHAWEGFSHLNGTVRQLGAIFPSRPRMVMGLRVGAADVWGAERRSEKTPSMVMRAMCECLSAGGQYNLAPFAGGTALAFGGGRLDGDANAFTTTNRDESGPVSQSGNPGVIFDAVRRVSTFASSFEKVFAGLEHDTPPAIVAPHSVAPAVLDDDTGAHETKRSSSSPNVSVTHASGSQGAITFVFTDAEPGGRTKREATLMLPDGRTLPVEMGDQPVSWYLFDAHLKGASTLNYANLSPLTLVGKTLVLFGPAGATGIVSINDAEIHLSGPKGRTPFVEEHEDITLVVCNSDTIDATVFTEDAVYVGAGGIDNQGNPIGHTAFKTCTVVTKDGEKSTQPLGTPAGGRTKLALESWQRADQADYLDGTNPRYARIDGPDTMESLGTPQGYAWLRMELKNGATRKPKVAFFKSADRLHLYEGDALKALVGHEADADTDLVTMSLKKGAQTFVALVDNRGRLCGGNSVGEPKGLFGHAYETEPIQAGATKAGKGSIEELDAIDPFAHMTPPLYGVQRGDRTDPMRVRWEFTHRKKCPVLVAIDPTEPIDTPAFVLVNDIPVALLGPGGRTRLELNAEDLNRGANTIDIAVINDASPYHEALVNSVRLFEGATSLTEKAEMAFARWEAPKAIDFEDVAKAKLTGKGASDIAGSPCWWRTTFTLKHTERPVMLDLSGMSKGQVFLNGENLCRYCVADRDGNAVPPQSEYYLPEPMLKTDGEANELLIFDEHGLSPAKAGISYE